MEIKERELVDKGSHLEDVSRVIFINFNFSLESANQNSIEPFFSSSSFFKCNSFVELISQSHD